MSHHSARPRVPATLSHRSLAVAVLASVAAVAQAQAQDQDHAKLGELVSTYCTECHNLDDYSGGLDLETFDFSHIGEQAKVGESMIRKLSAGVMPPPGKPRPKPEEQKMLVDALVTELDQSWHAAPVLKPPGIHRMNRAEYANAVSELLNLKIDPAALLPVDDTSYGFDNMAGSLGSSPALIEAYVSAAAKISRLALGLDLETTRKEYHSPPDFSQNRHVPGLPFGSRGGLVAEHNFPADGNYTFNWTPVRSNAGGLFGDSEGETLELTIDGELIHSWDVANENPRNMADERYVASVPVSAGPHRVGLSFVARTHMPSDDFNKKFERTTLTQDVVGFTFAPHVNALSITGPFEAKRPEHTASRDKVFSCYPENVDQETACAEEILTKLGTQAYRRPVTQEDTDLLMQFFQAGRGEGGDFDAGIQRSVQLLLADPEFIYRSETDSGKGDGNYYAISDLELASRLSFFIWSSPPDAELLQIAEAGTLREGDTLEQQVKRMLADPRASSLTQNFAAQWLQLRNLASAAPVADLFPDFDDNLRQAFRIETELLFESVMREDRDVSELLDANYTFLNERLAKHYGIPDVYGSNFRRVELPPEFEARRGLLGKGSVLTVASVADRTSTVRRGKWVLLNILGVIPPEPPPNVPALDASNNPAAGPQTMRERMSQHAANPPCSTCHQIMDPIGFALESFDATGKQRNTEFGKPLDLSGKLVDGQTFNGPSELRGALMKYKPQFVQTVAERLLTYALGRGVEYYDMPVVRDIVRKADQDQDRFSALILGVVESQPFQMNQRQVSSLAAQ
jgi:cytochrome c553